MRQMDSGKVWKWRLLLGVEAMKCIGWDINMYAVQPSSANANQLLGSLAGNAFRRFAAASVALALLAADVVPKFKEPRVAEISDSESPDN